ncbi:unnamed protein product [Arctogadus glacialis]
MASCSRSGSYSRYPIQSPRPGCYGDREDTPGVRNYGVRSPEELFDVYCFAKQLQGEVFHSATPEKLSLASASAHCQTLQGARLATAGQLYLAWQAGLDRCDPGWLADGSVRYPINVPRKHCGGSEPGVRTVYRDADQRTGFPDTAARFDAYCFRAQQQAGVQAVEARPVHETTDPAADAASSAARTQRTAFRFPAWADTDRTGFPSNDAADRSSEMSEEHVVIHLPSAEMLQQDLERSEAVSVAALTKQDPAQESSKSLNSIPNQEDSSEMTPKNTNSLFVLKDSSGNTPKSTSSLLRPESSPQTNSSMVTLESTPKTTLSPSNQEESTENTPLNTASVIILDDSSDSTPQTTHSMSNQEDSSDSTTKTTNSLSNQEDSSDSTTKTTNSLSNQEDSSDSTPRTTNSSSNQDDSSENPPKTTNSLESLGRNRGSAHEGEEDGGASTSPPSLSSTASSTLQSQTSSSMLSEFVNALMRPFRYFTGGEEGGKEKEKGDEGKKGGFGDKESEEEEEEEEEKEKKEGAVGEKENKRGEKETEASSTRAGENEREEKEAEGSPTTASDTTVPEQRARLTPVRETPGLFKATGNKGGAENAIMDRAGGSSSPKVPANTLHGPGDGLSELEREVMPSAPLVPADQTPWRAVSTAQLGVKASGPSLSNTDLVNPSPGGRARPNEPVQVSGAPGPRGGADTAPVPSGRFRWAVNTVRAFKLQPPGHAATYPPMEAKSGPLEVKSLASSVRRDHPEDDFSGDGSQATPCPPKGSTVEETSGEEEGDPTGVFKAEGYTRDSTTVSRDTDSEAAGPGSEPAIRVEEHTTLTAYRLVRRPSAGPEDPTARGTEQEARGEILFVQRPTDNHMASASSRKEGSSTSWFTPVFRKQGRDQSRGVEGAPGSPPAVSTAEASAERLTTTAAPTTTTTTTTAEDPETGTEAVTAATSPGGRSAEEPPISVSWVRTDERTERTATDTAYSRSRQSSTGGQTSPTTVPAPPPTNVSDPTGGRVTGPEARPAVSESFVVSGRWTPPAIKTPTPKEKGEGGQSEARTTETTDQNPLGAFLPNWGLAFNPSGRWRVPESLYCGS